MPEGEQDLVNAPGLNLMRIMASLTLL